MNKNNVLSITYTTRRIKTQFVVELLSSIVLSIDITRYTHMYYVYVPKLIVNDINMDPDKQQCT